MAKDDKLKALDAAIAQIERQYGKGSVMKLGDNSANMNVETVPTGSLSLDIALGLGGLPKGRIIEIYGPESSGKTTVALHCVAEVQKQGGIAGFIDAEHALDPVYAKNIGVDIDNLYISQPDCGEQALEITETMVRSGAVDIVIVDSVAALVPKAEIDGDMGDSHVGLQARLMSQALRKLTGVISKSNCIVIFINQLREKVGVMFGNPETTTGGRALKFYSSVRLDVRRVEQLKQAGEVIGNHTRVKVVKNKVAPPFREADNEDSVCDYVSRLTKIQEDVKDQVILVPRIYTNKPRTTGEGYKGIASQPDPEKAPDMIEGLIAMRKMHIRAIEESGLTCADEMLYPENWGYVEDLLSYVAIGARSVEDQQHRLTVSGFDVASGMKNPTSGDFSVMLNSVYAAQHPHHFVYRGYEVETTGNPLTHVVLRGAVSKHGNTTQNYHYEDLIRLHEMYEKMDVIHPAAIIDTNHSNSGKKFKEQIRIAKEVMHNRQLSSDIRSLVKGLMIESYIEEGNQSIGDHIYGKSITDPCLGWEDSKQLIYDIAEMNAK